MGFGTTFYEKVLSPKDYDRHLYQLSEGKLTGVEFTICEKLMPEKTSSHLIKLAQSLGLETTFHSPDFIEPSHYSLTHFKDLSGILNHYKRLFYFLEKNSDQMSNKLVLHSAALRSPLETPQENLALNQKALDALLNFISQKNLPILLCLENTSSLDEPTLSDQVWFLEALLGTFESAPLELCLDLAHWYRSTLGSTSKGKVGSLALAKDPLLGLSSLLLEKISYSHYHGFSTDLRSSHLPVKPEHSEYLAFVNGFLENKNQIILNLEMFDFPPTENIDTYESLIFEQFQLLENF